MSQKLSVFAQANNYLSLNQSECAFYPAISQM